ncbi:MAG: hypothetical protein LC115_07920 [Bacteroidia bacterium]|nr:hypothetical protein [Bacteroidia bacterium]
MAVKLVKYYQYVVQIKGISGKAQLAGKTNIPSIIAATMPDNLDNIRKFKKAIEEITGMPAPNF